MFDILLMLQNGRTLRCWEWMFQLGLQKVLCPLCNLQPRVTFWSYGVLNTSDFLDLNEVAVVPSSIIKCSEKGSEAHKLYQQLPIFMQISKCSWGKDCRVSLPISSSKDQSQSCAMLDCLLLNLTPGHSALSFLCSHPPRDFCDPAPAAVVLGCKSEPWALTGFCSGLGSCECHCVLQLLWISWLAGVLPLRRCLFHDSSETWH